MNPRLLELYNQELGHVREMGAEFARQFPKIASRLSLDGVEVADPYVERLLEGFAFLAARVQLKIEAEFPRFVQHLTEVTCPTLAAPLPSMAIVRLQPDTAEPKLAEGVTVARGTSLRSTHPRGADTRCQFRTAHDVALWPLEIANVQYFSFAPDLPLTQLPQAARIRSGLRVRVFHLAGPDEPAYRLYELIFGSLVGTLALPTERPAGWFDAGGPDAVRAVGFDDADALLPPARAGFRGYRLLQEYAALPQRFLFFEATGLARSVRRIAQNEFELVLLFDRADPALEALIDTGSLALHCTPAINLLTKRLDRVQVVEGAWEFHVVPDRTRPIDFEVYRIEQVTAYGGAGFGEQRFTPLYTTFPDAPPDTQAFFTVRREPRLASPSAREGPRSSYRGSEIHIALVDPNEAPFHEDIRQLAIEALVTNRDLPLLLPPGGVDAPGRSDFLVDSGAPVARVQLMRGPSRPRAAPSDGVSTWDLVSHLNLNYLSLVDTDEREGAAMLRSILRLHGAADDAGLRKQIEGVRSVSARQVVRRLPHPGPLTFGAGVEIGLRCDELAFQGGSVFLLSAVLERLFARYAGINSFTETAVFSQTRGEIKRWAPREGTRPLL
jgi:type VI secretion system protein ImpG